MSQEKITLPVFAIDRHRMATDGTGVTSLVGGFGCPLKCKYCINPHAWRPSTLERCTHYTPEQLYEVLKIDDLYFKATGGGITFGGGESLLHARFIWEFARLCPDWAIAVETSLNVPEESLRIALEAADEFIVDIKDMNPAIYLAYTGLSNERVLKNLELLAQYREKKKIRIRVPAIPEGNTKEDIETSVAALRKMGFVNIEVFNYVIFRS